MRKHCNFFRPVIMLKTYVCTALAFLIIHHNVYSRQAFSQKFYIYSYFGIIYGAKSSYYTNSGNEVLHTHFCPMIPFHTPYILRRYTHFMSFRHIFGFSVIYYKKISLHFLYIFYKNPLTSNRFQCKM